MKLLFENWREYLNEDENSFPYQIYCDMDGVLVDLVGAVLATARQDATDSKLRKGVEKIISIEHRWDQDHDKYQRALNFINDMVSNDVDFWEALPPTPDKDALWNFISPYNPYVLSHPWDQASADGKVLWVRDHLSPQPKDIYLTGDKHKYAVNEDGTPNLLIDDFEKYINPWRQAGGIAIHHTSAADTIQQLKEIQKRGE
jgi:hypothetical protein|tara:strand:+ start:13 stop:615 length:603 start_codon:yes stop_codon:yes gene_type:complete